MGSSDISDTVTLRRCRAYENGKSGIQIGAKSGSYAWNCLIVDCDSFKNGRFNFEDAEGFQTSGDSPPGLDPAKQSRDNRFVHCMGWGNKSSNFAEQDIIRAMFDHCVSWGTSTASDPAAKPTDGG